MGDWKPLSGRIGLGANAPLVPGTVSVIKLYSEAFGSDPQNFQQAQNPLMASVAQGTTFGMASNCILAPGRLDFNLNPMTPSGAISELKMQLIETDDAFYSQLLHIADSIGSGKIATPQEFDRPTVFAQFASIESDWTSANKVLSRVIPERYRPKLDAEEAFALQINHPKSIESGGESIRLNFVTKWSVEQFQVISFGMATGGFAGSVQPGLLQPQIQSFLGACLTFDCSVAMPSTIPGKKFFTRDQQHSALRAGLGLIGEFQREVGLDVKGFRENEQVH